MTLSNIDEPCVCARRQVGDPLTSYVCGRHIAYWEGSPDIALDQWYAYHKNFHEKDLDVASNMFGIYSDRCKWMLGLSQSKYMDFILKRFNMNRCKSVYLSIYSIYQVWYYLCIMHNHCFRQIHDRIFWKLWKAFSKYLRSTKGAVN